MTNTSTGSGTPTDSGTRTTTGHGTPETLGALARLERGGTIRESLPGALERSELFMHLAATSGPQVLEYLDADATVEDLLHWSATVAEHTPTAEPMGRVSLEPISDDLVVRLYTAAMSPETGPHWRFHGTTGPFQAFVDDLYSGTIAQFAVVGRDDGHRYGAVIAYRAQLEFGHCYVAFLRGSDRSSQGEMAEGAFHLVEHLFRCFPLRKVYVEIPGYNLEQLGLPSCFRIEGRLIDHDYLDGRWWDRVTAAVWADDWNRFATVLRPAYGK